MRASTLLARKMLIVQLVKIQLTKNKTIEVGFSRKARGASRARIDITGVELCSNGTKGAPAVRISRKKDGWHLMSLGFVPPPNGELPTRWEDVTHQPVWELPRDFQSPSAAFAVNSDMSSFGQASAEAILREMAQGLEPRRDSHPTLPARLTMKRPPQKDLPVPVNSSPSSKSSSSLPPPGKPVSENGRRFAVRPFAEDGFHLSASLPEFQALWLGRLLPEGRRPTASSIQLAESALIASPFLQPAFIEAKGSTLAILVRPDSLFFAGSRRGEPALWRRCPGVKGYDAMRDAVRRALGVDDELVNYVLEDSLVDPRPALEPFLQPVLQQLELARAYLAGKHNLNADHVLLLGLPCGAEHWRHLAEESLKVQLVPCKTFDGFKADKGVKIADDHLYLAALGAAIAASEVEL